MDQNCALMVKVVNCIGCWKKTVKIVFVTQRSDCTTQTEEETHSVLVVVEGPASDWSSVKTTLLHTQYPVGLCVLVNTNLSERGICRKARREFLTPGWYALREGCRQNLISQKTSVTDDTVVVPSNSFLGAFPSLMKTDFNPTNVKGHKNVIKFLIWSPPLIIQRISQYDIADFGVGQIRGTVELDLIECIRSKNGNPCPSPLLGWVMSLGVWTANNLSQENDHIGQTWGKFHPHHHQIS